MTDQPTERELALAARVKELEATAAQRSGAAGGIFEQLWLFVSAFVPPWIIGAALAVFLTFHAWEYYNGAQMVVAETQIAKAQAAQKDAEAKALNAKIGDEPLRLKTLQAELAKRQAEAARAKAEADAQNAMIDDASMRLATLQAQLANVQAQGARAKATAEAASKKFGLQTLEERAARAKLIITELNAATARGSAAMNAALTGANSGGYIRGACENNKFAELVGCPAQYITRGTIQSEPVTPTPSAATQKQPSFDCAKAKYSDELAICGTPSLAHLDQLTNRAFKQVRGIPESSQVALIRTREFLAARRACNDNVSCIRQTQVAALKMYRSLGSTVTPP